MNLYIKNFFDHRIELSEIASAYLDVSPIDDAILKDRDEQYAKKTALGIVGALEDSATTVVDALENEGFDVASEVREEITYITALVLTTLEALDIALPDHVERLARLNPDAASDLMTAIYGERGHEED